MVSGPVSLATLLSDYNHLLRVIYDRKLILVSGKKKVSVPEWNYIAKEKCLMARFIQILIVN